MRKAKVALIGWTSILMLTSCAGNEESPEEEVEIEETVEPEEEEEGASAYDADELTEIRQDLLIRMESDETTYPGFDPNRLPENPEEELQRPTPNRNYPFRPQRIELRYGLTPEVDETLRGLEEQASELADHLEQGTLELDPEEVHLLPAVYIHPSDENTQIAWFVVNLTNQPLTDIVFDFSIYTDEGEPLVEEEQVGASSDVFGSIHPNEIKPLYVTIDSPYSEVEWVRMEKEFDYTVLDYRELSEEEIDEMDEEDENFDPNLEYE